MSVREIPGFYYDQEKKKYFKIQAHHQVPIGSKYSRSNVGHVRDEEERARKAVVDAAERRTKLVQRSRILQDAGVAGLGMRREIEQKIMSKRQLRDTRSVAYGQGMGIAWTRNWERLIGRDVISTFAFDPLTKDIIVGRLNEHTSHTLSTMDHQDRHVYHSIDARPRSEVTSISISPGRVALATTLGGTRPDPHTSQPRGVAAEVHVMMLTGNQDDPITIDEPQQTRRLVADLRVSFFWHDETDIWTSAANPHIGPQSVFAVGMSDKVVLYSNGEGVWNDTLRMRTQSDAFATEWLSPNLLAIGQRDGIVKLWDTRVGGRAATALALQHPGPVSHIRAADAHRIVVHGRWQREGLCMYDMRLPVSPKMTKRKRDAKSVRQQNVSQPLMVYEHEGNLRPVGFDVSTESGLVAAVDAKNRVQLYALHSGKRVKTLETESIASRPSTDGLPTRTLQFVTRQDGVEELLGCTAGTMWSARG